MVVSVTLALYKGVQRVASCIYVINLEIGTIGFSWRRAPAQIDIQIMHLYWLPARIDIPVVIVDDIESSGSVHKCIYRQRHSGSGRHTGKFARREKPSTHTQLLTCIKHTLARAHTRTRTRILSLRHHAVLFLYSASIYNSCSMHPTA